MDKEINLYNGNQDQGDQFSLKHLTSPHNSLNVRLTFKSVNNQSTFQPEYFSSKTLYLPVFNQDKQPYTPSFMLKDDLIKCARNIHIYERIISQKKIDLEQEKSQMFIPRPSINNNFCCLCKIHFEDYMTHILNDQHLAKLQKSKYKSFINQLIRRVNKQNKKAEKLKKSPKVKKLIKKEKFIYKEKKQKKQKKQKNNKQLCETSNQSGQNENKQDLDYYNHQLKADGLY